MAGCEYFTYCESGQKFKIRTACLVLTCHDHVIMINGSNFDDRATLEFPGGKVEKIDCNIYDTLGRELWEEVFLRGHHEGEHLADWPQIKKHIIATASENPVSAGFDERTWVEIMRRVLAANVTCTGQFKRSRSSLKTMYFVVAIPSEVAKYLTKNCNAYLVKRADLQRALDKYESSLSESIRDRELHCMPHDLFKK